MTNFEKVELFMKTFGQEIKKKPSLSTDKINNLRINLIEEELNEFKEAIYKKDLKETADALTDILYVTYGAGHAFGINLDVCFDEVQKSNMSKLGNDGKPIYNKQGKVIKGPKYFKPDLSKLLTWYQLFKINISTSLIKYIETVKPIKKFQYINETVLFLILLLLTNSLSSRSDISLIPFTW